MRRKSFSAALAVMVLTAVISACGSTEEEAGQSAPKEGANGAGNVIAYEGPQKPGDSEWLLQSLDGSGAAEGSDITLYHSKAELGVDGGCMGFSLYHKLGHGSLRTVKPGLQVGRLDCGKPEEVRRQAEGVLDIVRDLARVRVTEDRFELRSASDEVAVFGHPPPAEVDPALVGTEWLLTSLEGEELLPKSGATLEIGKDGVGGSAGCNYYGSDIDKMADNSIVWSRGSGGGMDMTTIGCAGDVLRQETRYLGALGVSETYRIEGDRLKMGDGEGRTTLVFEQEAQWRSDPAELVGTSWVLRSTDGEEPRDGSVPTVRFESDEEISWYDGCQNFGGKYFVTENDLTVPGYGVVGGNCMKPEAFEDRGGPCVVACFGPEGDYRLREGLLEIRSETGETTSLLEPLREGEEPAQEGTPWVLRGFVEGGKTTPVRGDAGITLTFDRGTLRDRGTMFGSTGCNDYRVAYEHPIARNGPDRLVMAEPAVTKQRCLTGDAGGLEQRFLGILRDVSYYPDVTVNGRMSLDTADGRKLVFSAP